MTNYIIAISAIVVCVLAIYRYVRKLRHGDSCCTTGEARIKKVRVADRDTNHYPYKAELSISGMTCSNCAIRVENALNSLPGIWANVDLRKNIALVHSKTDIDVEALRQTVQQSGYTVTEIT
ncbi:MAG: heavy-metal-associated domain-containing protein [Sphaerochaetaceae bacterium]